MNRCIQPRNNRMPCSASVSYTPPSPSYQVLAMAYVPMQTFQELYEPCEGLENGTIFRQLNKPFLGCTVNRKGGCRC